ncbi:hypothetical protein BGZ52_007947 [Haplosporangium bisporale]|nr:hypothetical protein BGZ52_007947 [Haplosporangium bisporale]KAF9216694.1 hypothetical protein BGZ59_008520 [Podila verticillata]
MADITEEEFDSAFATNTKAPFFMREAAKHLVDEGRVTYVGTSLQAALNMFTRALVKDTGARGIMDNLVAHGPLDTAFF